MASQNERYRKMLQEKVELLENQRTEVRGYITSMMETIDKVCGKSPLIWYAFYRFDSRLQFWNCVQHITQMWNGERCKRKASNWWDFKKDLHMLVRLGNNCQQSDNWVVFWGTLHYQFVPVTAFWRWRESNIIHVQFISSINILSLCTSFRLQSALRSLWRFQQNQRSSGRSFRKQTLQLSLLLTISLKYPMPLPHQMVSICLYKLWTLRKWIICIHVTIFGVYFYNESLWRYILLCLQC